MLHLSVCLFVSVKGAMKWIQYMKPRRDPSWNIFLCLCIMPGILTVSEASALGSALLSPDVSGTSKAAPPQFKGSFLVGGRTQLVKQEAVKACAKHIIIRAWQLSHTLKILCSHPNIGRLLLRKKLDAGWPESEEEQVGNVKLEEEVTRRSKDW